MNFELNITLRCTHSCTACNRMCGIMQYTKADDMTLNYIDFFIGEAKKKGGVGKVKVLGGEPLLHPQFDQIYNKLLQALKEGIIKGLKIDHNHTIPFPKHLEVIPGVRLMGKTFNKKQHMPMIHPLDTEEGFVTKAMPNCPAIKRCGFSLDSEGYLPCSPAIVLERMYNFGLYRLEMPTEPWGLDKLCPNCPFSIPKEWQDKHIYALDKFPEQYMKPSKRYQSLILAYNNRLKGMCHRM